MPSASTGYLHFQPALRGHYPAGNPVRIRDCRATVWGETRLESRYPLAHPGVIPRGGHPRTPRKGPDRKAGPYVTASRFPFRSPVSTISALAVVALALTSCSAGDVGDSAGKPAPHETTGAYPVTLANCGREITIDEPIESAVALNQGITEILLSMGLDDRVAGTGTWTDPVRENLAEANADIPRLSDDNPSFETVLGAEPDFVAASFHNTLDDTGSGSFDQYAELGVPAYLASTECSKANFDGDGARENKLSMDAIYRDVRDLGVLFDEVEAGEALITELESRVKAASAHKAAPGTTAAFWFANSEAPYMAGGVGAPQIIADALGVENAFADSDLEWPQIGWEAIAAQDPDVLVIGDLTRKSETAESAKAKIEFLESHPVASQLRAVKEKRYIALPGADLNPSIRTVDGIETVAAKLAEFGLLG